MAVDFFDITDKKRNNILFSLTENDFELLDATLLKFKKLTGLFIDEYGSTRITSGHVGLIIKLLEEQLKADASPSKVRLSVILGDLKKVNGEIIAEGD